MSEQAKAKDLFRDLVASYLDLPGIDGIQSGSGATPELILFRGNKNQTLAVPLALLFEESRDEARRVILDHMTQSDARFLKCALSLPEKPWRKITEIAT